MDNVQQAFAKLGYKRGFDDGLKAAQHCRQCELIDQCEENEDSKTDFCPYAKTDWIIK